MLCLANAVLGSYFYEICSKIIKAFILTLNSVCDSLLKACTVDEGKYLA